MATMDKEKTYFVTYIPGNDVVFHTVLSLIYLSTSVLAVMFICIN